MRTCLTLVVCIGLMASSLGRIAPPPPSRLMGGASTHQLEGKDALIRLFMNIASHQNDIKNSELGKLVTTILETVKDKLPAKDCIEEIKNILLDSLPRNLGKLIEELFDEATEKPFEILMQIMKLCFQISPIEWSAIGFKILERLPEQLKEPTKKVILQVWNAIAWFECVEAYIKYFEHCDEERKPITLSEDNCFVKLLLNVVEGLPDDVKEIAKKIINSDKLHWIDFVQLVLKAIATKSQQWKETPEKILKNLPQHLADAIREVMKNANPQTVAKLLSTILDVLKNCNEKSIQELVLKFRSYDLADCLKKIDKILENSLPQEIIDLLKKLFKEDGSIDFAILLQLLSKLYELDPKEVLENVLKQLPAELADALRKVINGDQSPEAIKNVISEALKFISDCIGKDTLRSLMMVMEIGDDILECLKKLAEVAKKALPQDIVKLLEEIFGGDGTPDFGKLIELFNKLLSLTEEQYKEIVDKFIAGLPTKLGQALKDAFEKQTPEALITLAIEFAQYLFNCKEFQAFMEKFGALDCLKKLREIVHKELPENIANAIDNILNGKDLLKNIINLLYEIYNLTPEQINTIWNNIVDKLPAPIKTAILKYRESKDIIDLVKVFTALLDYITGDCKDFKQLMNTFGVNECLQVLYKIVYDSLPSEIQTILKELKDAPENGKLPAIIKLVVEAIKIGEKWVDVGQEILSNLPDELQEPIFDIINDIKNVDAWIKLGYALIKYITTTDCKLDMVAVARSVRAHTLDAQDCLEKVLNATIDALPEPIRGLAIKILFDESIPDSEFIKLVFELIDEIQKAPADTLQKALEAGLKKVPKYLTDALENFQKKPDLQTGIQLILAILRFQGGDCPDELNAQEWCGFGRLIRKVTANIKNPKIKKILEELFDHLTFEKLYELIIELANCTLEEIKELLENIKSTLPEELKKAISDILANPSNWWGWIHVATEFVKFLFSCDAEKQLLHFFRHVPQAKLYIH